MTVWSKLTSTIGCADSFRRLLYFVVTAVLITMLFVGQIASAAPSTSRTINFQGRILASSGAVIPDGNYNIQFKLYEGGNGQTAGNPSGTLVWTESYLNGADQGVEIKNGFMSVALGSLTPFGSSVNWDSSALWLSMNIAGTSAACSTFGSAPCLADGEMLPMKNIGAAAYAIAAGSIGGKTASDLLQLAQGVQVDASTNTSSIFINKTGTGGDLIRLQNAGTDVFNVSNNGSLTLGSATDQSISIATSDTDTDGRQLQLAAGNGGGGSGSNGGTLVLAGGAAGGTDGNGGNITIDAGSKAGTGSDGTITIGTNRASSVTIGNTSSTTTVSGNLNVSALDADGNQALQIGSTNATGINLNQNVSVAAGKSFSVQGDTSIRSDTDSANAFRVQSAAGVSQLRVDTANNRVAIGTSDSSGTLLSLDTKTSAGDPTGINGSMYYNSDAGKFRCFENGAWKDCITPLPVSATSASDTTNSTTTPSDIDDLSFDLAAKTKYYYKFVVQHQSAATTTGIGFGVTTPTSPVSSNWCVNTNATLTSSTAGQFGSYCGTGDASATTTGVQTADTTYTSTIEGYIETGEDVGRLKLRMKSSAAAQTTVKQGSFGILQIVQ